MYTVVGKQEELKIDLIDQLEEKQNFLKKLLIQNFLQLKKIKIMTLILAVMDEFTNQRFDTIGKLF